MYEKKSFGQRAEEFLSGKGFYIVLCVCVVIIGISAWFVYTSLSDAEENGESAVVSGVIDDGEDENVVDIVTDDETDGAANTEEDTNSAETDEADIADLGEDTAEAASVDTGDQVSVATAETISYVWPVSGVIENEYTGTTLVYSKTMADWRTHNGIDVACDLGSRVLAVTDGVVTEVKEDDMYGTTVVIDHGNGLESVYSNLAAIPTVAVGDSVKTGDVIGAVGDTADIEIGEVAHLHFEMIKDGEQADPTDYLPDK